MGRKKRKRKSAPKNSSGPYATNDKSFFATSETVGTYWYKVRKGMRRYNAIKGNGVLQKQGKPKETVVVVSPKP